MEACGHEAGAVHLTTERTRRAGNRRASSPSKLSREDRAYGRFLGLKYEVDVWLRLPRSIRHADRTSFSGEYVIA